MIVCVCRRVSDKDIAKAVGQGVCSFEGIQQCTGAGTGCGKCVQHAQAAFAQASAQQGDQRPTAAVSASGAYNAAPSAIAPQA